MNQKFEDKASEKEQKLDVKARGTKFDFVKNEDEFTSKYTLLDTLAGKKVGHIIDSRSDLDVYLNGKIADVSNARFETFDWTTVLKEHRLASSASETSLRIRTDDERDTRITFVGGQGAYVLKCFAEYHGYHNTAVCTTPFSEFVDEEQKVRLQAQKIVDEIFKKFDREQRKEHANIQSDILQYLQEIQWQESWVQKAHAEFIQNNANLSADRKPVVGYETAKQVMHKVIVEMNEYNKNYDPSRAPQTLTDRKSVV